MRVVGLTFGLMFGAGLALVAWQFGGALAAGVFWCGL